MQRVTRARLPPPRPTDAHLTRNSGPSDVFVSRNFDQRHASHVFLLLRSFRSLMFCNIRWWGLTCQEKACSNDAGFPREPLGTRNEFSPSDDVVTAPNVQGDLVLRAWHKFGGVAVLFLMRL